MAKTHEALLKAEKENKMNYLQPVRKPDSALAPLSYIKDLAQTSPEWCKELMTRLQTRFIDSKLKSLLFTGTAHGSGTSKTSADFASSLAITFQHKVLLIDANLRTPGIHKIFKNDNTTGLFDIFLNRQPRIEKNISSNLYVVSCNKSITREIDSFFGSNRFDEFIDKISESFDFVILDGPPVTSCSESLAIGAKVDGVILILEAGKTRKSVAVKAKNEIEGAGGNFLGVVLSKRKYYIPQWVYKWL
jgi:capsular exopolysaccharide synthesis family protein